LLKKLNELLTAAAAAAAATKLVPYRVQRSRSNALKEQHTEEQNKGNVQRFKTNLSNC